MAAAVPTSTPPKVHVRCRICTCALGLDDDHTHGVCVDCRKRPEGRRLLGQTLTPPAAASPPTKTATPPPKTPRPFTIADRSFIRSCHAFMPVAQILGILNERMDADIGADAPDYTLEQLHAEIATQQASKAEDDWSNLRQVLAIARRCGVLEQVTPQVIEDFAVVYRLSPAQVMHLRDVIRSAQETR